MATSVTAPTCEGFVRKSHGSRPFASRHVTRYLVADGFRVSYYADESRTSLKVRARVRAGMGMAHGGGLE